MPSRTTSRTRGHLFTLFIFMCLSMQLHAVIIVVPPSFSGSCASTCRPSQRKSNTITVNGCGPRGRKLPDFIFRDCCNSHDICYGDCRTSKEICDQRYASCIQQKCSQNWFCSRNIANIYISAVQNAYSCALFNQNRKNECTC